MPLIRNDRSSAVQPAPGLDDLTSRLNSLDAAQRWSAARGLAGQAGAASALAAALATETDIRVREAILTSLVGLPGSDGVAVVAAQLRSDDSAQRTAAMDALRALGPAIDTILPALLRDPDADVRGLVCDLARQLPADVGQALLCERLDLDAEPNVCAAAVDVLAETGDATCAAALSRCAARFADQPFLGFSVRIALDRIAAS